MAAVASIPSVYLQLAEEYGMNGWERLWEVTLPAIMPQIIHTGDLSGDALGPANAGGMPSKMFVNADGATPASPANTAMNRQYTTSHAIPGEVNTVRLTSESDHGK